MGNWILSKGWGNCKVVYEKIWQNGQTRGNRNWTERFKSISDVKKGLVGVRAVGIEKVELKQ